MQIHEKGYFFKWKIGRFYQEIIPANITSAIELGFRSSQTL